MQYYCLLLNIGNTEPKGLFTFLLFWDNRVYFSALRYICSCRAWKSARSHSD